MSEVTEVVDVVEEGSAEPKLKSWVQIEFLMKTDNEITTRWEETNVPLEEFNPFTYRNDSGAQEEIVARPGMFVGFPSDEDSEAMVYVQIVEVEAFNVTMVQSATRPE